MKNFLCKLNCILTSFARARAATELSRQGQHEAAKRIISEGECKC